MRLIDADDLVAKIMIDAPDFMDGGSSITKAFILAMVRTRSITPTIDAAPVVRCKDCEHYDEKTGRCALRYVHGNAETWFCADGKRRTDDDGQCNNMDDE